MCGIVGLLSSVSVRDGVDRVGAMSGVLAHRGPDDQGVFASADGCIVLGHRRLSIIDLSDASRQPMCDEPSGVVVVYNGEIYNFQDLRSRLVSRGHVFRTAGDTEVLLRAYLEWGINCLDHLSGMFGFAIWDPRSGTVHLARDATGMKPLYLCQGRGWVAFASEIKGFLPLEGFEARLDVESVNQFLEFGFIFERHRTSFKDVTKLEPGERVEVVDGRVRVRHVWYEPPSPDEADVRSESERLIELRSMLERVVREHLVADVPVGLLLSGGLDSSVVAAIASRVARITTISMGFEGSDVDERPEARRVSAYIGSSHVDVLISAADVRLEVERGAWVFDDLFADWGTVTTRLLYRRCRELGIRVVLVGEGADELFGGYEVFRQSRSLRFWDRFRLYQRYSGRRHGRLFGLFDAVMRGYLEKARGDAFHAIRLFESRRQLPNQYVMKVDKASMAESIEARAPYLDRRVADIAYRTPSNWLLRDGMNKYLLRAMAVADGLLPRVTANRKKFGAPLAASWMDEDAAFRAFAAERLLASSSLTRQLGYGRAMEGYFNRGAAGDRWPRALSIYRNLAWRLLLLELWAPYYLSGRRRPGPSHTGAAG